MLTHYSDIILNWAIKNIFIQELFIQYFFVLYYREYKKMIVILDIRFESGNMGGKYGFGFC